MRRIKIGLALGKLKIAYIIGAYADPVNLRRLVLALGKQDFFIHVDLKSDIKPFYKELNNLDNVFFVKKRIKVYWGGYTQIEMLLNCLNEVQQHGVYDRVVALSGMDFPAIPCEKIESIFANNPEKEFLRARVLTGDPEIVDRVIRYWKLDYPISLSFFGKLLCIVYNNIISKIKQLIGLKKPDVIEVNNTIWKVYFGSDYWALTWKSAMEVVKYLNDETIKEYFKSSYVPSEMVTQTIVCNTVNHRNIDLIMNGTCRYEDLCSLHYEVYEPIIQTMTENDFNDIISSNKMFFRKCRSEISDGLVKKLNLYYENQSNDL